MLPNLVNNTIAAKVSLVKRYTHHRCVYRRYGTTCDRPDNAQVASGILNHAGKMLAPIVDDAHLMEVNALRRLRLLFEDFPKNHNLVLVAQPQLLTTKLSLTPNDDIKSRVTYSVLVPKLAPDDTEHFIKAELDRVALPHNSFSDDALGLIVRASEGVLRRARNLCIACLLEAVRDRVRTVAATL